MRVVMRMAQPKSEQLFKLIFNRYPEREWGSFLRIGFHERSDQLILTLVEIDEPLHGDLNPDTWITEIQAQYTSRMLHLTDEHCFGVGFAHSHPQSFLTGPSPSDNKMEAYYAELLKPYIPGRPFVSLIFSLDENDRMAATGRVFWKDQCFDIQKFFIEDRWVNIYDHSSKPKLSEEALQRIQRLASQFSIESTERLAASTIGVIGASGTGSPCIELLARAGVGKLIIIDPEVFEESNLERVHGSTYSDIGHSIPKVAIAGRHVYSINPDCEITLLKGKLPQHSVVDELLMCDIILGCTDLHSARVAISDISLRYLIPALDIGVLMEGKEGSITGQVVQINRLFPQDPCVYCRQIINSKLVQQELMSPEEQQRRKAEADKAKKEEKDPNLYWIDVPQLNTVGYLTTFGASLVVGYTVGYLTGRFKMTKNRMEINLSPQGIQVVEKNQEYDSECRCKLNVGTADQDSMAIMSAAPGYWADVEYINLSNYIN